MRFGRIVGFGLLCLGGLLVMSFTRGQERPPASLSAPADAQPAERDVSRLNPLQRQFHQSAVRAADWLCRANRADGRFVYGYLPDLKTVLEGDHYLRQAGAAVALARAARYTGNAREAAVARQAILTLLLDTATDPQDARVRSTTLPSGVVNRVAAAGLLVLAVSELPAPGEDLLEQAEQLAVFIARSQNADGSFNLTNPPGEPTAAVADPDGVNYYPGEALYGLISSYRQRPAAWKLEVHRRALAYYRPWWQVHKSMAFVPWQMAAFTEVYLVTHEPAFAEFVYEMADWLCDMQYTRLDPRHPLWVGGFMAWADGKPVQHEPQIESASFAEGLVAACRAARQTGDLSRYRRYHQTLEHCLQFLTTLQYTDATTQHFADWYRPVLVGGFHASQQDGNLRIDYTQHALSALVQYLTFAVD